MEEAAGNLERERRREKTRILLNGLTGWGRENFGSLTCLRGLTGGMNSLVGLRDA